MPKSTSDVENSATAQNILDAALESFGGRGYSSTSLDQIAAGLGVRKQTILYWFPNKEALLDAAIDRSAQQLTIALEMALAKGGSGLDRVEAVVRAAFRLAADRPEVLGLVREAGRLGAPAAARLTQAIGPLLERAAEYLDAEMKAGQLRQHDARFFLLSAYSVVIGVVTETEVLRALGMELTPRAYVMRRNEVISFLRNALFVGSDPASESSPVVGSDPASESSVVWSDPASESSVVSGSI